MSAVERLRPHADPTAERQWIACAMSDPRTLVEHPVPLADIYTPSLAYVLGALESLRQRGAEIDTATLRLELQARGDLGRVGEDLVLGLTDSVVPLSAAGELAATIRRHALTRRMVAAQRRALELAERGDVDGALAASVEIAKLVPTPIADRTWAPAPDLARTLRSAGPPLPTGLATLDKWTNGGLRAGKLVAIGGAPGAGKTLLATDLAHRFYDAGHPVLIYAADEPREASLVRWGQRCGLVRDDLEAAEPHTVAALSRELSDRIDIVDPDEATLDHCIGFLGRQAARAGSCGVLVLDSIQTARIDGGDLLEVRIRIDRVVRMLKSARDAGLLVLATSEVPRSFYAKRDDQIDPLAAFKESGSIEYALDVALVLQSVKDENGRTDVFIPKNRIAPPKDSEAPAFRFAIDFDRARANEVPIPMDGDEADEQTSQQQAEAQRAKLEKAGERLVQELLKLSVKGIDIKGQRDLRALIQGRSAFRQEVVSHLIVTGRIEGGGGKPWRVRRTGEEATA